MNSLFARGGSCASIDGPTPLPQIPSGFGGFDRWLAGGLVIEMDGSVHAMQNEKDAKWDKILNDKGFRFLCFWNGEVEMNLAERLRKILAEVNARIV